MIGGALLVGLAMAGCAEEPVVAPMRDTVSETAATVDAEPTVVAPAMEPSDATSAGEDGEKPLELMSDDERILALIERVRACAVAEAASRDLHSIDFAGMDATFHATSALRDEGAAIWPHLLALPASDPVWAELPRLTWGEQSPPLSELLVKLRSARVDDALAASMAHWLQTDAGTLWENGQHEALVTSAMLDLARRGHDWWPPHYARDSAIERLEASAFSEIVMRRLGATEYPFQRERIMEATAKWGPDCADFVRRALPTWGQNGLQPIGWDVLAASAGTVPEALPLVRDGLRAAGSDDAARATRRGAALALSTWGDAALPALPELRAMFASDRLAVRTAAARSLASLGVVERPILEQLSVGLGARDIVRHVGPSFLRGEARAEIAAQVPVEALDMLLRATPERIAPLVREIAEADGLTKRMTGLFATSRLDRAPAAYVSLLREWMAKGGPQLRLAAAGRLAVDEEVGQQAVDLLAALAGSEDAELALRARETLAASERDRRQLSDLESASRQAASLERLATRRFADCDDVIDALAATSGEIPRLSPDAIAALLGRYEEDGISIIRRSEGHEWGLEVTLERFVADPDGDSHFGHRVPQLVTALGEAAIPREKRVLTALAAVKHFPMGPDYHAEVIARTEGVFAGLRGDALALARHAAAGDPRVLERLASADEWRAALLYIARSPSSIRADARPVLSAEGMTSTIRLALLGPRAEPDERRMCLAAASLVYLLPETERRAALRREYAQVTAEDDELRVGAAIGAALVSEAIRTGTALPHDLLDLLEPDPEAHRAILEHGLAFRDDARLRRLAGTGSIAVRLLACRMLVDVGIEVDQARETALEALRWVNVAHSDIRPRGLRWNWSRPESAPGDPREGWQDDVVRILLQTSLEPDDAQLLLRAVSVTGSTRLLDALGSLGADAAAVVPALRRWLAAADHPLDRGRLRARADAVVRTLEAIGPAASDALPDLRLWLQHTNHPAEVARAIVAIEGE